MSRLVVIGDTGADTVVVHVGDLVRCSASFREGNRESAILIERLILANPSTYVQLLGNHESAVLGGPYRESWDVEESLDESTADLLSSLWYGGSIQLATTCVTHQLGPVLITHAGLTRARWEDLGSSGDPVAAAEAVNRDVGRPLRDWSRAGRLVGHMDEAADTTWAEVNLEFYEPWILGGDAPFSQIHGHASPFNWQSGAWWPDAPVEVQAATQVDHETRRTATRLSHGVYAISVDWNFGDAMLEKLPAWRLLELDIYRFR